MSDPIEELDWRLIVVRFDPDRGRVIVDPGDCDLYSAVTILQKACERIYDEIDEAMLGEDDVLAEEDDNDDE